METNTVKQIIEKKLPECQINVTGDGSHFDVEISGAVFTGKSTLEKHKLVYATVNEYILNGEIHALNIKASAPDE